jgi:hypothetical protein
MAKRRGSNEGSIYQDSDGRWRASVNLGFKAGKRCRKLLSGRTRAEVDEKLNTLLNSVRRGLPVTSERMTTGQYLETWLEQSARPKVRAKTFRTYEQLVRTHLKASDVGLDAKEINHVPDVSREQLKTVIGVIAPPDRHFHNAVNDPVRQGQDFDVEHVTVNPLQFEQPKTGSALEEFESALGIADSR